LASADPYELLGVARDAPRKDIQKAYRRRAKEVHPDLNPGDGDALDKFQALSIAYGILGVEAKRARFDRGEIDASGAEQPRWRYHYDAAQARRRENSPGFTDFRDSDHMRDKDGRAARRQAG
jgi:curved DNA-binding protein CbpA